MNYITLLKTNRQFRLLWYIDVLLSFGSWFTAVSVYDILINFKAGDLMIALIAAFHWLPGILQAPISGIFLDRINPKKLLFILLFVEALATLAFLTVTSKDLLWLMFVFVFIKMSCASFLMTAVQSFVPKIVKSGNLRNANDTISVTWSLNFVAGMALGGLCVHIFGTNVAIIFDVALFVVSLFILKFLSLPQDLDLKKQKITHLLRGGVDYLFSNKNIIKIILLHATVGFTSFDALVALLASKNYASTIPEPLAIGTINSVRAVGLFLGPIFFSRFQESKRLLVWLMSLQGVAIILWAALQFNFYASLIGTFATGFFTSSIWSITYSFLQREANSEYRGRVIAYNDMVFLSTNAVISVSIGFFANLGAPLFAITAGIGALFILSALIYKLRG
ncbi:MAG: MFS transporter [Helicobacteraceae bacterium]